MIIRSCGFDRRCIARDLKLDTLAAECGSFVPWGNRFFQNVANLRLGASPGAGRPKLQGAIGLVRKVAKSNRRHLTASVSVMISHPQR
jgi:hypothetical protein